MGLRDQLLKAGLVSKKQARKAETDSRRVEHQARKDEVVATQREEERLTEQARIEQEREKKREEDRRRNLEIEAARLEKEKIYRVRQLLKSNDLFDNSSTETYFFVEADRFVRNIQVTHFQREMLARGKFGIVRSDFDDREFVLVPAHTVATIHRLAPDRFYVLHSAIEDWQDLDEIVSKELSQGTSQQEQAEQQG
jgi:uncharacterized protein YaiL (DUF2058 family)